MSWLRADADADSDSKLGHSADVSAATPPHQVIGLPVSTHTYSIHAHREEHACTHTHRNKHTHTRTDRESERKTETLKLSLKDTKQRERVLRQQEEMRNESKTK